MAGPTRSRNTYTPSGKVKTLKNSLGQLTEYEYDDADRIVGRKQADGVRSGRQQGYARDALFLRRERQPLVRDLDPRGIAHSYEYDGLNRLTKTTVLTGPAAGPSQIVIAQSTYNAINKLSDTDIHGNTTTYAYDGLYRLVETTLPVSADANGGDSAKLTVKYDLVGNVLFAPTPTTPRHDLHFRRQLSPPASSTDALGNVVSYTYDNNGNVLSSTNQSSGLTIEYKDYDGLNRAHSIIRTVRQGGDGGEVDSYETTYDFDDAENTVTVTDDRGGDRDGATAATATSR